MIFESAIKDKELTFIEGTDCPDIDADVPVIPDPIELPSIQWDDNGDDTISIMVDETTTFAAFGDTSKCSEVEYTSTYTWTPVVSGTPMPEIIFDGFTGIGSVTSSSAGVLMVYVNFRCGANLYALQPLTLIVVGGSYYGGNNCNDSEDVRLYLSGYNLISDLALSNSTFNNLDARDLYVLHLTGDCAEMTEIDIKTEWLPATSSISNIGPILTQIVSPIYLPYDSVASLSTNDGSGGTLIISWKYKCVGCTREMTDWKTALTITLNG